MTEEAVSGQRLFMPYQPDRIDFKILSEQQADGRLTIVELARRISLTKTLCLERAKQLEKAGSYCFASP